MVDAIGLARDKRPQELGALLEIYAYVDHKAARSRDLAEKLRPLIGEYPSAAGWYDALALRELVPPRPDVNNADVDDALRRLSDQGDALDRERHPQRLLAIAALLRVSEQSGKDLWEPRIITALKPLMAGEPDERVERANALFDRLNADDAGDLGSIVKDLKELFPGPNTPLWNQMTPCATKVNSIQGKGPAPIVTLTTTSTVSPPPTLQEVNDGYLHPEQWPLCCDFWCEMRKITSGSPARYKEVIGFDCTPGSPQRITTFLDFVWGSGPPGVYSLEYTLSADQRNASQLIDIDEGSIIVEDLSPTGKNELKITTTKRVRFIGIDSKYIAFWACAFGYADVGRAMVLCTGHGVPTVKPTPEQTIPSPGAGTPQASTAASTAAHAKPPGSPSSLVDAYLKALTDCWTKTASDYTASLDKALSGTYRPDDLVKDAASFWARYVNEMSTYVARPADPGTGT